MALDENEKAKRIKMMATIMSLVLVGITVSTNFDPKVEKVLAAAWGDPLLGMPVAIGWSLIELVLMIPLPICFLHGLKIARQAMEDRNNQWVGTLYLLYYIFVVGGKHPELKSSQLIVIGGLLYFIVLSGAWIAYAASKGI